MVTFTNSLKIEFQHFYSNIPANIVRHLTSNSSFHQNIYENKQ